LTPPDSTPPKKKMKKKKRRRVPARKSADEPVVVNLAQDNDFDTFTRISEELYKYKQRMKKWKYLFTDIDDFPKNLDPLYLGDYLTPNFHSEENWCPPELKPYVDGEFFIKQVEMDPDRKDNTFDLWFVTDVGIRSIYFYKWDGKRLKRAVMNFPTDRSLDADAWDNAHLGILDKIRMPGKRDWITLLPEFLDDEYTEDELRSEDQYDGVTRNEWLQKQWEWERNKYLQDWTAGNLKYPVHRGALENFDADNLLQIKKDSEYGAMFTTRDPKDYWPYLDGKFFVAQARTYPWKKFNFWFGYSTDYERKLYFYKWDGQKLAAAVKEYSESESQAAWCKVLDQRVVPKKYLPGDEDWYFPYTRV
jgi:hypothetical protein